MKKKNNWKISIDDGFVEYRAIVIIDDKESIDSVYTKIRELFKSPKRQLHIREGSKESTDGTG